MLYDYAQGMSDYKEKFISNNLEQRFCWCLISFKWISSIERVVRRMNIKRTATFVSMHCWVNTFCWLPAQENSFHWLDFRLQLLFSIQIIRGGLSTKSSLLQSSVSPLQTCFSCWVTWSKLSENLPMLVSNAAIEFLKESTVDKRTLQVSIRISWGLFSSFLIGPKSHSWIYF